MAISLTLYGAAIATSTGVMRKMNPDLHWYLLTAGLLMDNIGLLIVE